VKVEVRVVYATEEKLKERVRVYKMEDGDGRVGVDILVSLYSFFSPISLCDDTARAKTRTSHLKGSS